MDTEKEKLRNKVAYALDNCQNMSYEELKSVCDEVITYAETLGDKAGGFIWEIGLEPLSMIVSGIEYTMKKK